MGTGNMGTFERGWGAALDGRVRIREGAFSEKKRKEKKKNLRSFSHVEETHTHTRQDPHSGLPFGVFFFLLYFGRTQVDDITSRVFGEFELEEEEEGEEIHARCM